MERTFTALFYETEGWVVGLVEELPGAIVQERTIDEARASMLEVIPEILEANRDIRARDLESPTREELTVTV